MAGMLERIHGLVMVLTPEADPNRLHTAGRPPLDTRRTESQWLPFLMALSGSPHCRLAATDGGRRIRRDGPSATQANALNPGLGLRIDLL